MGMSCSDVVIDSSEREFIQNAHRNCSLDDATLRDMFTVNHSNHF